MNIQPVGSLAPAKLDERTAVEPQGTTVATGNKNKTDEREPSRAELSNAVKKINESILGSAQRLEFSIDEDSKDIVVKIIDQATREIVRQIPSKEALDIARSLDKMRGLLINHTA